VLFGPIARIAAATSPHINPTDAPPFNRETFLQGRPQGALFCG
jgi:hypothetical protein